MGVLDCKIMMNWMYSFSLPLLNHIGWNGRIYTYICIYIYVYLSTYLYPSVCTYASAYVSDIGIYHQSIHLCHLYLHLSSVQSLSHVWLFETPRTAARQASLSITNSWSLFKLMSIWVGDTIQPSHPLSSPSPPNLTLSQHQGLSKWVSSSHQVAKVLEFQLQYQEIFRTDFL